jgi:hypothetical protein
MYVYVHRLYYPTLPVLRARLNLYDQVLNNMLNSFYFMVLLDESAACSYSVVIYQRCWCIYRRLLLVVYWMASMTNLLIRLLMSMFISLPMFVTADFIVSYCFALLLEMMK